MKKIILSLVVLMTATLAMADKKNEAKAVFTTNPVMHCASCETKIKSNLRFVKGVKDIATDIPSQTVTVTYNPDKTSKEKIVKGFSKIGYEAREVKGGAKAGASCCGGKGKGECAMAKGECAKAKATDATSGATATAQCADKANCKAAKKGCAEGKDCKDCKKAAKGKKCDKAKAGDCCSK